MAGDAMQRRTVVSLGVGPMGQMGGGVVKKSYNVPMNYDGDAGGGVGVIYLEQADGLGDQEGKVAEDAVL